LRPQKAIPALPFKYYFLPTLIIALVGLGDSVYLSISHYRVYRDIGYSSFCAISRALNCDTVSQSSYAILLGVPIAVWAMMGYGFFLTLLLFSVHQRVARGRLWSLLFGVALAYSFYSVFLAYISSVHIHSYCLMCILSYAVNFLLLFYTWLVRRRFGQEPFWTGVWRDLQFLKRFPGASVSSLSAFVAVAIGLVLFFPAYWEYTLLDRGDSLPSGMTEDGHPWIGAEAPELVIEEYSDYQCFQCRKMHYFLRRLINKERGRIRLVHRQYPMDHKFNPIVKEPFHEGSGIMALVAIYAAQEGKFWEVNDMLFDSAGQQKLGIRKLMEKAGLDADKFYQADEYRHLYQELFEDIRSGIGLKIEGTPTFVINGEVYPGNVPRDILAPYID